VPGHIPVLSAEVLELLAPRAGETVLDVTVGLGSHAATFLKAIQPGGRLVGFDADTENLEAASRNLRQWERSVELRHVNFREIAAAGLPPVDIIFADLGLSSPHVEEPHRGFTFRADAPLDLRYDRTRGETAAEMIARASEQELSEILRSYGEVRQHRRIARVLKEHPVETTMDLRRCVEQAAGYRAPAILPQVFQAFRIAVNDELGALETLLSEGPTLLRPGGRMGVISYHSLEDRMVKQTFRALALPVKDSLTGKIKALANVELLTKKPVVPSPEEIARNPRARSARLRGIRCRAS
jgi:16S rRNA (cytosine1402-N4)-methyltransferase